jgi:hypothetical protein
MAIQVIPRRSKAQAFGELFGGALQGINQGQAIKRQRAQDDAMAIWKLAQTDPMILGDPRAKKIFELAGWPEPQVSPQTTEQILANVPKEYGATVKINPMTGRPEAATIAPNQNYLLNQLLINQKMGGGLNYGQNPIIGNQSQNLPANPPAAPPPGNNPSLWQRIFGGQKGRAAPTAPLPAPVPLNSPAANPPGLGEMAQMAQSWLKPDISMQPGKANRPTQNRYAVGGMGGYNPNIKLPAKPNPAAKSKYKIGQPVNIPGKGMYKVVGFDTDGEPLVEPI